MNTNSPGVSEGARRVLDLPYGLSSILLVAAAGAVLLAIFACIHYCYKLTLSLRSPETSITTTVKNLQEYGKFPKKNNGYLAYQNTDRLPLADNEVCSSPNENKTFSLVE